MLSKLRRRAEAEQGFTLIELLVVILIIGILAAIAIPSFLNQTSKAKDASAKELARSAQTAAETYATDHSGSYTSMTTTQLNSIEPTIPLDSGNPAGSRAYLFSVTAASGTGAPSQDYAVTTQSVNGNKFTITRDSSGNITHTCTASGTGASSGGCVNDTW
jgi:type IV pilus assembly protein PilA